ncbi:MAG: hypothetical protein IJ837_04535 [Clostridia bacterium]|nr:hypothetical protein [Clostridia bacterium]
MSYFYYCYKIEDVGKTLGVDLSFLPENTTNKTASDIVKILSQYKNGYTEMTLKDAKEKLGLDIEEVVSKNLGIEINDFYDISISIKKVNGGKPQKVGDLKIQDILNNTQEFVDNLLAELYKKVSVAQVLELAQIDLSTVNKPITNDKVFDVNPDAKFEFSGTTYVIDFTETRVYDEQKTISVQIKDKKFTINETEFTISDNKKELSYNEETITLTYNHIYKTLSELTMDELLNSVIPDYVGGESLTLKFIQDAFELNLIDEANPEYEQLLNTKLSDLELDNTLDDISLRSLEELLGLELIPLDDENERYNNLLDLKAGQLTVADITKNLQMGAFLDLLKVSLPDLPFLSYDEFKNQTISNISDYMKTLKVRDFINNIISEVHPYTYFVVDNKNYYINDNKVFVKDVISKNQNTQIGITSLNNKEISSYTIYGKEYLKYDNKFYKINSSNIDGDSVTINGITYYINESNIYKDSTYSNQVATFVDGYFTITDESNNITVIGKVSDSQITYYAVQENSKIIGKVFRITITKDTVNNFSEDTEVVFRVKENGIEYLKQVAVIESETFTLNGITYTLTETDVNDGTNSYELQEKNTTLDIALYSILDLTVKDIINGDLSELTQNDAKLNNLTINEILSTDFDGILKYLDGLTLGEIVEQPTIMLDRIKLATFAEILKINDESNALLKSIKDLTIGDVMDDPGKLIEEMGKVTFADLGLTDTSNPIINKLKDVTIQQVLDKELENKIKDISLSELTNSTTGIMSILGDLTIGNFNGSDAITTRLKESNATLSDLLEKEVYFFDYFEMGDIHYIIENLRIGDITAPNGIYKQSGKFDITENDGNETVEIDDITYYLNIQIYSDYYVGTSSSNALSDAGRDVMIEDNKFIFNNKVYVISEKYVYEYSQDTNISSYSITSNQITITTLDPASTNTYDITKINSLNNAMLSIKLSELFGDDYSNIFKSRIQQIKLADILTDTSNTLISAIINKNPDVTISSIGETITSLKMADVFGESQTFYVSGTDIFDDQELTNQVGSIDTTNHILTIDNTTFYLDNDNTIIYDNSSKTNQVGTIEGGQFTLPNMNFNKGILKLLGIKDTALLDVVTAVNSFDFASQTMSTLIDEGILDFGAKNNLIKTNFNDYTIKAFAEYMLDINNKNVAELIEKGLLDFGENNNTISNEAITTYYINGSNIYKDSTYSNLVTTIDENNKFTISGINYYINGKNIYKDSTYSNQVATIDESNKFTINRTLSEFIVYLWGN